MLKIQDLPANITPAEIREVAQSVHSMLMQTGTEIRLNEQRHFDMMLQDNVPNDEYEKKSWAYIARRDELAEERLGYINLLDELKRLHEEKESK